jgi:hypothetical protein|tara:strand:+ start:1129 stop:1308 length:180 start_codon:yes stop_codon:yes gene_type:complete
MLEADYQTWVHTLLFPFMPVITLFLVSFVMLGDLPWDDDDDDDDRDGGIMIPAYVPSGA